MIILGISAYYHDSAAALIRSGEIVAAAQEERFSRKKHDSGFPEQAIKYCLQAAQIELSKVDQVIFYDKPLIKFERLLETYVAYAPRGFKSFLMAMPVWLKEKLYLKTLLRKSLSKLSGIKIKDLPPLLFAEHHQSHAASAFFPSPFERAAVLCMDGVGEWATTSVWLGENNTLKPQWEIVFPHSLGLLYSAFTYYTGFKVNSGEYKLMGLAPYGESKYVDIIKRELIDIKEDGSFRLNMDYFSYATGLTMTSPAFSRLFDGPPRKPESEITQKDMDLAASIQKVTEEVVLKIARTMRKELDVPNLCLAGGVALNCVANGKLLREKIFDRIWIQPAAGDAGGALGSALACWYEYNGRARQVNEDRDAMKGAYLGPSFSTEEARARLEPLNAKFEQLDDEELYEKLAAILADEKVVGWFQGPMEFGPRALGGRSIIGDPRSSRMQSLMNLKIKYRESFRPFAPAVLADQVSDYFEIKTTSPYMLLVANVKDELRREPANGERDLFGIEKLKVPRSTLPAITHVDYSARIQTVEGKTNPRFYSLLERFQRKTGCGVLINTSFNVRSEPIVCTPEDAYRCFMRTEMDYLAIENLLFAKEDQPPWHEVGDWRTDYELD
jgi:carbamoyltransferase